MRRLVLLSVVGLLALAGPAGAAPLSPGSAGLGDRLFPQLGNGGYDAIHYDVDLRYATSAPAEPMRGTVRMLARATQGLSRFDLDFAGESVGGVLVNGRPRGVDARRRGPRDHAARGRSPTARRSS